MRPGAFLLVLLAALGCEAPPSATTADASSFDPCLGDDPDDPQLAELMSFTRNHIASLEVPGAAVAIVREGAVDVVVTGSRRPLECEPLTGDSRFFSLFGRHITASTLIAAAAAGELSLDDPITDHLPAFGVAPPGDASAITLHHLLTGTAGYPVSHILDCRDIDTVLELRQQIPVWSPPGSVHLPLFFDFGLAGNALGDYRAAVRRHVTDPLGLTGTFDRIEVIKGDVATGARRGRDTLVPVPISLVGCAISEPYLGFFASARDAGAYLAALLAADGDELVGREDAFYPPQRSTRGGFIRVPLADGGDWLEASATTQGHGYSVRLVPEAGFAVAVFINAGFADPNAIADEAVAIFTGAKRALDLQPPPPSGFAALAGTYRDSLGGMAIEITLTGEALSARVDGGETLPLAPATRFGGFVDDVFALEVGETTHTLRFWRDSDGVGQIISEDSFRGALAAPFFRVQ